MSAFVLEDGVIYYTYATYARGLDVLWGMYQWLDRAPKGRNETGIWGRRQRVRRRCVMITRCCVGGRGVPRPRATPRPGRSFYAARSGTGIVA
jgi:hypothetical protein